MNAAVQPRILAIGADLAEGLVPPGMEWLEIAIRPPSGPLVTLAAVGDTGFSGEQIRAALKAGAASPFAEVEAFLRSCDVAFANLEGVLTDDPLPWVPFAAPTRAADLLAGSGLGVVCLANNHVADHGPEGLGSTLDALEDRGLLVVGAGRDADSARGLVVVEAAGLRIGFLAAARTLEARPVVGPWYCELEPNVLVEEVKQARTRVDVVVVSLHTGFMYLDYPDPELRALGHRLAAAGAGAVLVHHPHVLQGIEVSAGGVVCYSLGNFLVDWQEGLVTEELMVREQQEGGIFRFEFDHHGLAVVRVLPTVIEARRRVRFATGDQGRAILERLTRITADLDGDYLPVFRKQRAQRNARLAIKTLCGLARRGKWRDLLRMLSRGRPDHIAMLVRWLTSRRFGSRRNGAL